MTALERAAREIFAAALAECDPGHAVSARLGARPGELAVGGRTIRVAGAADVRVAAVGKAAGAMFDAVSAALDAADVPPGARRGLVVAPEPGPAGPGTWAERVAGDHPVPGARSFAAGRRLLDLFSGCTGRTLALFLVSGGGSALAEWPLDERLTPDDLARLGEALVRSSLSIREINAVRKRLSAIKGGRLALRAAPAEQLTLVVSDVPPGEAHSVASGPTVPDETTAEEAAAAIARGGLARRFPGPLGEALARAAREETPKAADLAALRASVEVVLDCEDAARAAGRAAGRAAARAVCLGCVDGPLEEVAVAHLAELARLVGEASEGEVCAVVSAGEVTLEVTGAGLGGRNQQTALYALTRAREACPRASEVVVLSAGTDGRDGPTDAAGAAAGLEALDRAAALGLDAARHLGENDAYRFFDPLGALLRTGPTGTNVRDVRVFLARR